MSYIGRPPAASPLTSADITDGIIVEADLANDAVTAAKLASNAVTAVKLADDAVTVAKLADDAVTAAKLASNAVVNASVDSGAAIDDEKIAPPYYSAVSALPAASSHHGRVVHAHSEGKMYYSHSGSWLALARDSDLPTNPALLASDQTFTGANRGTITSHNSGTNYNLSDSNNFSTKISSGTPVFQFTTDGSTTTLQSTFKGQSGNILLINSGATFSKGSKVLAPSDFLTTINTNGTYWISYVIVDTGTVSSVIKALVVSTTALT